MCQDSLCGMTEISLTMMTYIIPQSDVCPSAHKNLVSLDVMHKIETIWYIHLYFILHTALFHCPKELISISTIVFMFLFFTEKILFIEKMTLHMKHLLSKSFHKN